MIFFSCVHSMKCTMHDRMFSLMNNILLICVLWVLKYCNFEEYYKCILLMCPKGDVLFLHRDVTNVFGHHRVMRYNLHCKSGQ